MSEELLEELLGALEKYAKRMEEVGDAERVPDFLLGCAAAARGWRVRIIELVNRERLNGK